MLLVICYNIRSRENIGSVFRTSDAFGVSKIFLTGYTPTPPHPKISKTALGAESFVAWEKVFSPARLIQKLKKDGWFVVALECGTRRKAVRDPKKFLRKKKIALIVGNEVSGIPQTLLTKADAIFEIPMKGKKESLNVAVAFGVAAHILTNRNGYCTD
ncbi:MAG: TrmH family RNA methyltransferase [Candidatus Sungbacteria bacterium]|nr:TrmH family RNA methyltransferase [Candidatus Sungbacteria bacterium]